MRHLARLYEQFIALLGVVAVALIALITAGICVDVVSRNLGLGVIRGMLELTEYALFLITFLGAPWALRHNAHISVDIVVQNVQPAVARALDAVANLAGIAVAAVLAWYAISIAAESYRTGARIIKELIFPEWWVFAAAAFSALLLLVEFAARLYRLFGVPPGTARQNVEKAL